MKLKDILIQLDLYLLTIKATNQEFRDEEIYNNDSNSDNLKLFDSLINTLLIYNLLEQPKDKYINITLEHMNYHDNVFINVKKYNKQEELFFKFYLDSKKKGIEIKNELNKNFVKEFENIEINL